MLINVVTKLLFDPENRQKRGQQSSKSGYRLSKRLFRQYCKQIISQNFQSIRPDHDKITRQGIQTYCLHNKFCLPNPSSYGWYLYSNTSHLNLDSSAQFTCMGRRLFYTIFINSSRQSQCSWTFIFSFFMQSQ